MRLVIVLAVAAAVTVMLGLLLMAASVVMRLLTRHQPAHMARLGLDVVAVGIAFGLVVLAFFIRARNWGGGRISDYFRQSSTARPGDDRASPDQAETDPGIPRHRRPPASGPTDPPESTRVTADQPRAW